MRTYKYQAVSKSGQRFEGIVQAENQSDAVIQVNREAQMVIAIKEIEEDDDLFKRLKQRKIKDKDLSLVCRQFAIILTAGLPIVRTVQLVADQTEDKELKKILTSVAEDVQAGHGLSTSFAKFNEQLPATFIETVSAGELSGSLDIAFDRMANYYATKAKTRSKVSQALTYPAFVLAIAVVVIGVIMVYAMPTFATTFKEMDMDLPVPTLILIGLSDFFTHWGWLAGLIVLALVAAVFAYGRTESGRYNLDTLKLKIPVLGRIQLMSGASEFANTFSTMLAAGLPATRALSVTGRTLTNYFLAVATMRTAESVEQGYRIGDVLRRQDAFPDLLVEMTGVGEQSGSLEETLQVIGAYYDNEVDVSTTKAISLLEPIILVVLAVFAALILLAVYMPMFSLYGSI